MCFSFRWKRFPKLNPFQKPTIASWEKKKNLSVIWQTKSLVTSTTGLLKYQPMVTESVVANLQTRAKFPNSQPPLCLCISLIPLEILDSKPHCLTQISTPHQLSCLIQPMFIRSMQLTFDCTRQIESFRHFDFCYCSDIDVRARESLLKAFVAFISTRTSEHNDQ